MNIASITVSRRLRELLAYDKFAGPAPRVMVFEGVYWVDRACISAAQRLGWSVLPVRVPMQGVLPRDTLHTLIKGLAEFRPDFVLTVNMAAIDQEGLLVHLLTELRIPLVTWFVDNPRTILMDCAHLASPYTVALTWERAYTAYLEALGFAAVHTLPLAAEASWLDAPTAGPPCARGAAFVGNSMAAPAADARAGLRAFPRAESAVEAAFDQGRVTRGNFALGVDALLGDAAQAAREPEPRRHAELYCFVEATRRLRAELLAALAPEGVEAWGDDGWRAITPHARGSVNYHEELPAFYRSCAVNLNATSIQMPTAVNQRVFDCPAAGGFLLTDAQHALGGLFDVPAELAVYKSIAECREMVRYYKRRPAERNAMVRAARQRVANEHTYERRLRTLAGWLRERYG